jgi:hypothetical protein
VPLPAYGIQNGLVLLSFKIEGPMPM